MVSRGSEHAFAALYERYHQPLYRYSRSIVQDDADAQDVLQSTFASALVALRRGARDAPLRPWLFRIAHNEAISLIRRRRPSVELSQVILEGAPSAADQANQHDRISLLMADLAALGHRQRSALVMRELSGLSHKEIALALDTSESAAKQAIFEARRTLLEFAEGRSMACEEIRRALSHDDRRMLRSRRVRAHLRDCGGCRSFAEAIPARSADLHALAPPLAPLAAAALARSLFAGSAHAGHSGALAAAAAGKSTGALLAAKTLIGVAMLSTAAIGTAEVLRTPAHSTHRRGASSRAHHHSRGTAAHARTRVHARKGPSRVLGVPAARTLSSPATGVLLGTSIASASHKAHAEPARRGSHGLGAQSKRSSPTQRASARSHTKETQRAHPSPTPTSPAGKGPSATSPTEAGGLKAHTPTREGSGAAPGAGATTPAPPTSVQVPVGGEHTR
ncbi:MAG: hypothetical protein QOI03_754 [Solirubrobacteraceae bacterium]|nr:hypothetical protein [Solirubrobacteraceae bacterium]